MAGATTKAWFYGTGCYSSTQLEAIKAIQPWMILDPCRVYHSQHRTRQGTRISMTVLRQWKGYVKKQSIFDHLEKQFAGKQSPFLKDKEEESLLDSIRL
jgi:hypothetical protein